MTHDDDPRSLWHPSLLQHGLVPWDMQRFTPRELTQVADWLEEVNRGTQA